MVASASVWLAVTSAPGVTLDLPMRPEIGARTCVYSRLMRAVASAAFCCATVATACW